MEVGTGRVDTSLLCPYFDQWHFARGWVHVQARKCQSLLASTMFCVVCNIGIPIFNRLRSQISLARRDPFIINLSLRLRL